MVLSEETSDPAVQNLSPSCDSKSKCTHTPLYIYRWPFLLVTIFLASSEKMSRTSHMETFVLLRNKEGFNWSRLWGNTFCCFIEITITRKPERCVLFHTVGNALFQTTGVPHHSSKSLRHLINNMYTWKHLSYKIKFLRYVAQLRLFINFLLSLYRWLCKTTMHRVLILTVQS